MKWLVRLLLVLLLLVPAALFLAVGTEQGTRTLIQSVARLLPLEIEYAGGKLTGVLLLKRLRFDSESLQLDIHDLVLELEPDCLWRGALCFTQVQSRLFELVLQAGKQDSAETLSDDSPGALIVFPLPIEVESLLVEATQIRWPGGEWQAGQTRGRVRMLDSSVQVSGAVMSRTRLLLQDSNTDDPAALAPRTLSAISLPLQLNVSELRLLHPQWDIYGAEYQQDTVSIAGNWQHSHLRVADLAVTDSELGDLSLRGELEFSGDWPLQVMATAEVAQTLPREGLIGQTLQVELGGDLRALALQVSVPGKVGVVARGEVDALNPELPFTAALTASSANSLLIADIEDVGPAAQDGQLEFPVELSASGTLKAQAFEVRGAASGFGYESLQLLFRGTHEAGNIALETFSVEDATGASLISANGQVSLEEQVRWSLALQSDGIPLPAINARVHGYLAGSANLSGSVAGEAWAVNIADVQLDGQVNDQPAALRGFAGLDSTLHLQRSDFEAQLNGGRLSLKTSGEVNAPGHVELTVDDLSRWSADAQGKLHLQARVSADREHIDATGSMHRISWGGLSIANAKLAGTFQTSANRAFTLQAQASAVRTSDLALTSLKLSATGDSSGHNATLSSEGDIQGRLAMTGSALGKHWQGVLAPSRLATPYGDWALTEPLAVSWAGDEEQLSLAPHCWINQYAQVCPQRWLLGASGGGTLDVTGDMKYFSAWLTPTLGVGGDTQLHVTAHWTPDTGVTADGRAQIDALTLTQQLGEGESATVAWDVLAADFTYAPDELRVEANVQREQRKIVAVSLRGSPQSNGALTGSLRVDHLRLAMIAPLLPALSAADGDVNGELLLSGTLERPLAHGQIVLSQGQLALAGNPTELEKLAIRLDFKGDWAQLDGDGLLGGGALQLDGKLVSNPDYQLELALRGDNHALLYPPSMELQVSEDLQLVVNADVLDVSGKVTVLSGVLEFEQLPEDSVSLSSSVVEVDYAGNAINEELPIDISLDIQVKVEKQLKITGKSLQTTLGGDLHLQQQRGRPLQLFGQLNTFGGHVSAYNQRLVIRRGTLSFTGPPDNPNIDVRAEREISGGDVTVGVRVQGPLQDDLLLDIYSSPAMSQANAISYLVRGRPLDTGAGADGTALALSLAAGVANRSALVSELNRIPGLNNVEFGAQGSQDETAATVSGYIGERIYLSYGFGLYEPVNVLTARLYFTARLWFEVVSSLENSADLYYSFDID